MMQTMHITLIFMCKYRQRAFQVWFWLFSNILCLGFFIIFWGFCKGHSGVFLHNRVATLMANDRRIKHKLLCWIEFNLRRLLCVPQKRCQNTMDV